jgi:diketogulonate reductase-like aldo/keto reductase
MTTIPTTPLPDGTPMPVFGLGTWMMGEERNRATDEVAALRAGLEAGVTLIDTAEMYGSGGSERIVAEAIAGRRDELMIVSKVLPSNASKAGTITACERSLANLGTDRIDIYLLHWRGRYGLDETVSAFEKLRADGKILRWGVSNFDLDDLAELDEVAPDCATNQVLYNLSRRGIEYDLLPAMQKRGMPLMAYSPIEQGRLAKGSAIEAVAARHNATPAQIALAFVLAQPGVVAIPKSSRPDRVEENLGALAITLTDEDRSELDAAYPPPRRKTTLEML